MSSAKEGDKHARGLRLACDTVALNYLRSNGFSSLASEFQASRHISSAVANSFRTLSLERISGFIQKKSQADISSCDGNPYKSETSQIRSSSENLRNVPSIKEKSQADISSDGENPNKSEKSELRSSSENSREYDTPRNVTSIKEKTPVQKEVASNPDKSDVEDVYDRVVADYLKRNGFSEVLDEFQTCRNIKY